MASCSALGCVLLLFLVPHSYSLCVIKEGSTSCCDSSLILMSSSQLKRNNGSSLTIKDLPSASTISSNYTLMDVDVLMGTMPLEHNFTDSSKTTLMVKICCNIEANKYDVSLSFYFSDLQGNPVSVKLDHVLILRIISDPKLVTEYISSSPHLFCCDLELSPEVTKFNLWTEFKLNDETLGYCGEFINPVEHKKDISIQYDDTRCTSRLQCSLQVNKLTSKTEGNYSCSVMISYPDGIGYLRLNSNKPTVEATKNNDLKITLTVIGVLVIIIIGLVACGSIYCYCRRNRRQGYENVNNQNEPG